MAVNKRQTNETLRSDIWRACDILRRDNNVGGVVEYTEHLAPESPGGSYLTPGGSKGIVEIMKEQYRSRGLCV